MARMTYDCASLPPIGKVLEDICSDICDNYCKWPEKYETDNESQERMYEEHCDKCPLLRISV